MLLQKYIMKSYEYKTFELKFYLIRKINKFKLIIKELNRIN